jgi:hypothetical protein
MKPIITLLEKGGVFLSLYMSFPIHTPSYPILFLRIIFLIYGEEQFVKKEECLVRTTGSVSQFITQSQQRK